MHKLFLGLITLVFSLCIGQTSFADTAPATPEKPCGCGGTIPKMADSLKLDDAQQTRIKAIKEQLLANEETLNKQMDALRGEINQLIEADSLDQSKLETLVNQKKALIGDLTRAKIIAKNQIYITLNAEQKSQYALLIAQWESQPATCH
ncbi:MAG: Spy/CpxP family protein refolding chaperone [Tatlockia sp.]|jgi:Spy/CpxP family protein refolding chaperone